MYTCLAATLCILNIANTSEYTEREKNTFTGDLYSSSVWKKLGSRRLRFSRNTVQQVCSLEKIQLHSGELEFRSWKSRIVGRIVEDFRVYHSYTSYISLSRHAAGASIMTWEKSNPAAPTLHRSHLPPLSDPSSPSLHRATVPLF